jgi:glucosamine-6-phosphate deaminase
MRAANRMSISIHPDKAALGSAAAREGAAAIAAAIEERGSARVVFATGASQFEMLDALVTEDVDWRRVTAFHLDEYVGLSADHPASFRRYLRERVVDRLPRLREFVMIEGDAGDTDAELTRLNARLAGARIDVCFAGIGENCHLAFNDPPADFEAPAPYILVKLDEACRRQQTGEGWFASVDEVPRRAVSMSIRQIMKSEKLVLSVSDARKAEAVHHALEGPVTPQYPASIVQRHPGASLHLDPAAASLLRASAARASTA